MWLESIFNARATYCGGVIRRSVRDVERYASRESLIAAVKAKGFHLVETGDQFVIICNDGQITLIC